MIIATLYLPQQVPHIVPDYKLGSAEETATFSTIPSQVPILLDCRLEAVDVLASGPHYVAYSVFDFEGPANQQAMEALTVLAGISFSLDDEDTILCGPILIVQIT